MHLQKEHRTRDKAASPGIPLTPGAAERKYPSDDVQYDVPNHNRMA